MTSIVDDCTQQCILPDGQSTLFDALPPFEEELGARDVTVEELSLPSTAEPLDDHQAAAGSSLPATPAERPCTFCPSSLPLPPASCPTRATLVLDLDGTLIASEELNAGSSAYLWNTPAGGRTPDYEAMGRRVWLRPGVKEFLAAVRPHFEIVLFTAATQNWAAAAIEQLDPLAELFDVMLHRDHTTSDLMWDYVKDLSRLGRDLARVVIVDDNPLMFMYQPDNALHIGAYEASVAGGPDNVLPRVAEVLINQVASATDVREVLGPMASAKSCITSTVSAMTVIQVATETHGQISDMAAVAASGNASAAAMTAVNFVAKNAACGMAISSDGEGMQYDALADERQDSGECGDSPAEQDEQQRQGASPEQLHLGDRQWSSGARRESESICTISDDAEKGIDWESDSDGAETFDEHGAAAQLGADVAGSCERHRAWEATQAAGLESNTPAAAQAAADAATGHESDACPPEEHSVHSSEDFEALMDDAMAEYDSDSYEGGAGYDYAVPPDTAVAATVLPENSTLADDVADSSHLDVGGSSCYDVRYPTGCDLRPCGCSASGVAGSGAGKGVAAPQVSLGLHGVPAELSQPHTCAFAVGTGPAAATVEPAVHAATTSAAAVVRAGEAASLLCREAEGPLVPLLPFSVPEDAQPQSRQQLLPTGMVFLMDLNPAFGTGCAPLDTNSPALGSCDASALPALAAPEGGDDGVRAGEVIGYKRTRSDAELGGAGSDVDRDVIARLSYGDAPHSSRDLDEGTCLLEAEAVVPCAVTTMGSMEAVAVQVSS